MLVKETTVKSVQERQALCAFPWCPRGKPPQGLQSQSAGMEQNVLGGHVRCSRMCMERIEVGQEQLKELIVGEGHKPHPKPHVNYVGEGKRIVALVCLRPEQQLGNDVCWAPWKPQGYFFVLNTPSSSIIGCWKMVKVFPGKRMLDEVS